MRVSTVFVYAVKLALKHYDGSVITTRVFVGFYIV